VAENPQPRFASNAYLKIGVFLARHVDFKFGLNKSSSITTFPLKNLGKRSLLPEYFLQIDSACASQIKLQSYVSTILNIISNHVAITGFAIAKNPTNFVTNISLPVIIVNASGLFEL
jgi:hypothetical protein